MFRLEFGEDVRDVVLDRALGDVQPSGNLAVARSLRQQHQHLAFTLRHIER